MCMMGISWRFPALPVFFQGVPGEVPDHKARHVGGQMLSYV